MLQGLRVREVNCDPALGMPGQDRCPHCGLWHLRAGYCQALDPGSNWSKRHGAPAVKPDNAPEAVNSGVNTGPVNTPDVNADRKAYMREYMRRKRSAERDSRDGE